MQRFLYCAAFPRVAVRTIRVSSEVEFTYFSLSPSLYPPFFPFLPLALLFMFLLELSDSYVQHKEAVLLADDATHVRKDSDVSACIRVCVFVHAYI